MINLIRGKEIFGVTHTEWKDNGMMIYGTGRAKAFRCTPDFEKSRIRTLNINEINKILDGHIDDLIAIRCDRNSLIDYLNEVNMAYVFKEDDNTSYLITNLKDLNCSLIKDIIGEQTTKKDNGLLIVKELKFLGGIPNATAVARWNRFDYVMLEPFNKCTHRGGKLYTRTEFLETHEKFKPWA